MQQSPVAITTGAVAVKSKVLCCNNKMCMLKGQGLKARVWLILIYPWWTLPHNWLLSPLPHMPPQTQTPKHNLSLVIQTSSHKLHVNTQHLSIPKLQICPHLTSLFHLTLSLPQLHIPPCPLPHTHTSSGHSQPDNSPVYSTLTTPLRQNPNRQILFSF